MPFPEIGQYTSPEPLHAVAGRRFYGPQAFGYATRTVTLPSPVN